MPVLIPRSPWPSAFPQVVIHNALRARNTHPSYPSAKSGDADAARVLVETLLSHEETERLVHLLAGRQPILLPITADEVAGFNAIPDAMAQSLALRLGLSVAAGKINQANKVGHTKADGWHRLVTPAAFNGDVIAEADYILVDDHVGFGGTLANLRGFVEQNGGTVIGMTTLTETREARQIAVRNETLNMLYEKHGSELADFWNREFGHGLDCLTNIEGEYLYRVESVAAIKTRMAQAAELARGRGLSPVSLDDGP
jgi:adenine/guanine phosphoribosyltransferase-like PRPP-binding protein